MNVKKINGIAVNGRKERKSAVKKKRSHEKMDAGETHCDEESVNVIVIHNREEDKNRIVNQINGMSGRKINIKHRYEVLEIELEEEKQVFQYLNDRGPEEQWQKMIQKKPVLEYFYRLRKYGKSGEDWDDKEFAGIEKYFMNVDGAHLVILHNTNTFAKQFYKRKLKGKKIVTIIISGETVELNAYEEEQRTHIHKCLLDDQCYIREFLEDWWENGTENEKIFGEGIRWVFDRLDRGKNAAAEDTLGALQLLGMQLTEYFNRLEATGNNTSTRLEGFPDCLHKNRLFRPLDIPIDIENAITDKPKSPSQSGWYWFDYCLRDASINTFEKLAKENSELKKCSNLKQLWLIIRGECLGKDDGLHLHVLCSQWEQIDFIQFLKKARKEWQQLCNKSIYLKQIDDFRTKLNHTYLKNGFLTYIGDCRKELPPQERFSEMLLFWRYLKIEKDRPATLNKEKATKRKMKKQSLALLEKLNHWWEINELLTRYFDELPGKCHFKVTEEFIKVKQEAAKWREIISDTVRQFNNIGLLPENETEICKQLELCYDTVQEIHAALNKMKLSKRFDTYFIYVIE